jgi:hypothetical protein
MRRTRVVVATDGSNAAVGCQNSITPLTLEFAGAGRSPRCEF